MRELVFDAIVIDGVGYVEYGDDVIPFFSNPEYDSDYAYASGWIQVTTYEADYGDKPISSEYSDMSEYRRDMDNFEPEWEEVITDILVSIT